MIVKNWMLPMPYSVSSDTYAVEAAQLIADQRLKMLPVIDNGRLRGIVHRRDLSEAMRCVTGSGEMSEMNYFRKKLKVKDIMVRMPATVSVDDTVEETLVKGRQMMMSTFPVLDDDRVVGMVSDREIFVTLYKILQAGMERTRITLADVTLEPGTLVNILRIVEENSALPHSIFTVPQDKNGKVRVMLRIETDDPEKIRTALIDAGFSILEFR